MQITLISARRDCIDYVIVHELCHVLEPRMQPGQYPLVFDDKRMIYGGFAPIVDA